jgi:hypothetical protein
MQRKKASSVLSRILEARLSYETALAELHTRSDELSGKQVLDAMQRADMAFREMQDAQHAPFCSNMCPCGFERGTPERRPSEPDWLL